MPGKFWLLSLIDYRPLLNPGFNKRTNQTLEPPTGAEYNTLHQESWVSTYLFIHFAESNLMFHPPWFNTLDSMPTYDCQLSLHIYWQDILTPLLYESISTPTPANPAMIFLGYAGGLLLLWAWSQWGALWAGFENRHLHGRQTPPVKSWNLFTLVNASFLIEGNAASVGKGGLGFGNSAF